jgi:hypothetical protein
MQIAFHTVMYILPIISAFSPIPQVAHTDNHQIRTVSGQVLCRTPFQLGKAIIALHLGHEGRIRRLGCMETSDGMKGIIIDQSVPFAGPWQVRLMPEGGPAFTMWAYAWSLRTESGKGLWPKPK